MSEVVKWSRSRDQVIDRIGRRWRQRDNADNMLGDDIKRLFQNFDRIEGALPHKLCRDRRFHEVVDVGGDENAVAALV